MKDPPAKAEAPPKEEKKDKKDKGGKAAPAAADQPEFTKLDIRVGVLTKTWHHPESDKLWCEEIDIGEAEPRQAPLPPAVGVCCFCQGLFSVLFLSGCSARRSV